MTAPLYRRRWRTITVAQPLAGADWTLRPTGGATWRVVSLVARLVTLANAGLRQVTLTASDGERIWFAQPASATQTINLTVDYAVHTGATPSGAAPGTLTLPLPSAGLLLRSGHRLTVVTSLIQVDDQWSRIVAVVDETLSSRQVVGDQADETHDDYSEG